MNNINRTSGGRSFTGALSNSIINWRSKFLPRRALGIVYLSSLLLEAPETFAQLDGATLHLGIPLEGVNGPLITRGRDPFNVSPLDHKAGHGRWGLFLESDNFHLPDLVPGALVLGIPEGGLYHGFEVARYYANGSRDTLLHLNQDGVRLQVRGGNGELAYIGGRGGEVLLGSHNPFITTVSVKNSAGGHNFMNMKVGSLTIMGGADLSEPFAISRDKDTQELPPGSVVVIDENNPGHLKRSEQAYDTRVAGIISGAGGINSGIELRQEGVLEAGQNVALTGRVYALADATEAPIKPGDLLTTSTTAGHAMKVTNHGSAQGAILGKAMTGLKEGKGLVLVLVSLQ